MLTLVAIVLFCSVAATNAMETPCTDSSLCRKQIPDAFARKQYVTPENLMLITCKYIAELVLPHCVQLDFRVTPETKQRMIPLNG